VKQLGHVVVNSMLDRPWSQYFRCLVAAHRERSALLCGDLQWTCQEEHQMRDPASPQFRVRVLLEKIRVLDDRDPLWCEPGELRFPGRAGGCPTGPPTDPYVSD
jgi:hypothetical protein